MTSKYGIVLFLTTQNNINLCDQSHVFHAGDEFAKDQRKGKANNINLRTTMLICITEMIQTQSQRYQILHHSSASSAAMAYWRIITLVMCTNQVVLKRTKHAQDVYIKFGFNCCSYRYDSSSTLKSLLIGVPIDGHVNIFTLGHVAARIAKF